MPRFVAPDPLLRIDFEGDILLFNPLSWETHVLNDAAAAVFDLLQESACSVEDVAGFLTEMLDEAERPRAAEHAATVLRDLAALALIREEGEADATTV